MKKLLVSLLVIASINAFASVGDSVNTGQDYQKVKMYNSVKDNACLWQGGTSYPIPDARVQHGEVAEIAIYYKHNDSENWQKTPYLYASKLPAGGNGIISCSSANTERFAYDPVGYLVFTDDDSNTELSLEEIPPKNTKPTSGDNIIMLSMSSKKIQTINGKEVVCTVNGTGTVQDYTRESITLLCEDKQ